MYKHFLVPVDGTTLSTEVAKQAVKLAQQIGAKITFLYATPDFSATSDGALLIAMAPDEFSKRASGDTTAILASMSDLAKAGSVSFDTACDISDHPYAAIIKNAKKLGCDLIFMASHHDGGLRGLISGSQTEKVVRHSTIPVLVTTVTQAN